MSLYLDAINEAVIEKGGRTGQFILRGDDAYENIDEWFLDDPSHKPTKDEVKAKYDALKSDWDAKEYQRHRSRLYPSLGELADAIYHKEKGDNSKMTQYLANCDAVKTLFPSNNSGDGDIFLNPQGAPKFKDGKKPDALKDFTPGNVEGIFGAQ